MSTISSIGTTGRNYSTVQAWHDAFTTGGWIGETYNDSEFTSASAVTFSGKTVTVTDFLTLRTAAGQSFKDNANAQTNALKYNVSNGVGHRKTTSYGSTLDWSAYSAGVTIQYQQFNKNGNVINGGSNGQSNGNLYQGNASGFSWLVGNLNFNDLVIDVVGGGSSIASFNSSSAANTIYNCTFATCSDKTASTGGVHRAYGSPTITNCAVFGCTHFSDNSGWSGDYNATSGDSTNLPGAHSVSGLTYSSQFQGTTSGAPDFRVKSGSSLIDAGISESGTFTTDIVGTARPQGSAWDIGCWEFVSAAPTVRIRQYYDMIAGRAA